MDATSHVRQPDAASPRQQPNMAVFFSSSVGVYRLPTSDKVDRSRSPAERSTAPSGLSPPDGSASSTAAGAPPPRHRPVALRPAPQQRFGVVGRLTAEEGVGRARSPGPGTTQPAAEMAASLTGGRFLVTRFPDRVWSSKWR